MSQYRSVSHIYVSRIWQQRPPPPPQISAVISAARAGCCRMEIQCSAAQMGEAAASAPQKRSVCFNADKADIFRGVSQTIPMKEQSPIWQRGRSENPLCHAQPELRRQNTPRLYIGPYRSRTSNQQNITLQARTSERETNALLKKNNRNKTKHLCAA